MADEKPEPCTTWSYRLQHLSLNLGAGKRFGRQVAQTLCGAEAFDQAEMDEWSAKWGSRRHKVRITDMPACSKCARKGCS
jgi:hypothetical protein